MRSPLDNASIKKLKGYKLAYTPPLHDESSEVGILIGNDNYGEILISGKVEIDKGLLESKLGWILSGRTNTKQEPNYTTTVFTQTMSRIQNQINNNLTMETALSSDPPIEDFGA